MKKTSFLINIIFLAMLLSACDKNKNNTKPGTFPHDKQVSVAFNFKDNRLKDEKPGSHTYDQCQLHFMNKDKIRQSEFTLVPASALEATSSTDSGIDFTEAFFCNVFLQPGSLLFNSKNKRGKLDVYWKIHRKGSSKPIKFSYEVIVGVDDKIVLKKTYTYTYDNTSNTIKHMDSDNKEDKIFHDVSLDIYNLNN